MMIGYCFKDVTQNQYTLRIAFAVVKICIFSHNKAFVSRISVIFENSCASSDFLQSLSASILLFSPPRTQLVSQEQCPSHNGLWVDDPSYSYTSVSPVNIKHLLNLFKKIDRRKRNFFWRWNYVEFVGFIVGLWNSSFYSLELLNSPQLHFDITSV